MQTENGAEVRERAQQLWNAAEPVHEHHFFEIGCWGVAVPGLRRYPGDLEIEGERVYETLIVPMRDAERRIQNLAFVRSNGARRYLSVNHLRGLYWALGSGALGRAGGPIAVIEGFLRGA